MRRQVFIISLLLSLISLNAWAIGASGWYATRIKFEYQYSDYNSYAYPRPTPPIYPDVEFAQPDPYISEFPEYRSLIRITQAFGPTNTLQFRYQYSKLTETKLQRLFYTKLAREVSEVVTLYAAWQLTEQPDYFNGWMTTLGGRFDQGGWIVADGSGSYFRNRGVDGSIVETFIPSVMLRYSLTSSTALTARWDGYFATGEKGKSQSNAAILSISQFLPTQTALHLMCRLYDNSVGLQSLAPAFEIAQYLRWNLTLRTTYRYYENLIDNEEVAASIDGNAVRSHSLRGYLEWQLGADWKLNFKLRRYWSNQHIIMNTYLIGFEYLI